MGRNSLDLTGQRFTNLRVIRRAGAEANEAGHAQWLCDCDCGALHIARGTNLTAGTVTRCKRCSELNLDPAAIGRETVVSLWYYAAGEEGGFAVAKDAHGRVLAHTPWLRARQKLTGPPSQLKLARMILALLAEQGTIRARKPKEGAQSWAKATNVTVHAHMFTPKQSLDEHWAEATITTVAA